MYLSKNKFQTKPGSNIEPQTLARRYGDDWLVSDADDGYQLTTSGRLFLNAGYQNGSLCTEFTIVMPRRRIMVGNAPYWPFDELSGDGGATPVWQDVSQAIAKLALSARCDSLRYGIIPGTLTYDKRNSPTLVVCPYPDTICFYANGALNSFAGRANCNLFRCDRDNKPGTLDLAIIPIALANAMLEKTA